MKSYLESSGLEQILLENELKELVKENKKNHENNGLSKDDEVNKQENNEKYSSTYIKQSKIIGKILFYRQIE